jgi:molecular chaperone GrpE
MSKDDKKPKRPEPSPGAGLPETEPVETPAPESSDSSVPPAPEELTELRRKAAEYDALYEKFQRAAADFQNSRKRLQRLAEEQSAFAIEEFAKELLRVSDDLSRAVNAAREHQTVEAILDGLHLVEKDLYDVMARHGIALISVERGDPFDPEYHEAVAVRETGDLEPNRIAEEVRKGFLIHQRLLRAARVVVTAPPAGQSDAQASPQE